MNVQDAMAAYIKGEREKEDVRQWTEKRLHEVLTERDEYRARLEAAELENKKLRAWCKFILIHHDEFTEHDPDGMKEYTLANISVLLDTPAPDKESEER